MFEPDTIFFNCCSAHMLLTSIFVSTWSMESRLFLDTFKVLTGNYKSLEGKKGIKIRVSLFSLGVFRWFKNCFFKLCVQCLLIFWNLWKNCENSTKLQFLTKCSVKQKKYRSKVFVFFRFTFNVRIPVKYVFIFT